MELTIAMSCYGFSRRLAWTLQSILEQQPYMPEIPGHAPIPKIVVDVVCPSVGPEMDVVEHFQREGVDIRAKEVIGSNMSRAIERTEQLRRCETEWILFTDCDMVRHPTFFARMARHVQDAGLSNYAGMISAGRKSNPQPQAEDLIVEKWWRTGNVFAKVDVMQKTRCRDCGAGHFQLVNLRHAPHEGYYSDDYIREGLATGIWLTPSDSSFRKRISALAPRVSLPKWFSINQIHLNHERDTQVGYHITRQR